MGAVLWGVDYRSTADPRPPELRRSDRALTEKAWQAEVVGEARRLGYVFIYHHRPAMVGKPGARRMITNTLPEGAGFPDLLFVRYPVLIGMELKTEAKAPADKQVAWLEALGGLPSCIAVYARPRDRALVFDLLRRPWAYLPQVERGEMRRMLDHALGCATPACQRCAAASAYLSNTAGLAGPTTEVPCPT